MKRDYTEEIALVKFELQEASREAAKHHDYMYRNVQFFIAALVTIVVFALNVVDGLMYRFIFQFVMPVASYVFGLFYCYNRNAITKITYFQKICESKIKILSKLSNQSNVLLGWTYFNSKNTSWFILPYGTLLMFFILFPPTSILLSFYKLSTSQMTYTFFSPSTPIEITFCVLSILFCITYVIFMGIMIHQTNKVKKLIPKAYVSYTIDEHGHILFCEMNK